MQYLYWREDGAITFTERMVLELEKQGRTKIELADYLGMKKSAFSMWLSRNSLPPADVALKVAKFLNVSVEYLIDGKENKPTTDVCIQKIIELLKDFEQKDKCRVLQLVSLFQQLKELDKKLYIEMGELLLRVKSG